MSFFMSSAKITSSDPSMLSASSLISVFKFVTAMNPVAFGSYYDQISTNAYMLNFCRGSEKWSVYPKKASIMMATKRLMKICMTRRLNKMKKAYDMNLEPHAKGSPPLAMIES